MTRADHPELTTERLRLRRFRAEDHLPFARLNADPLVMGHFPRILTSGESDALITQIERHFETHGFSVWACTHRANQEFLGAVGLQHVAFDAPFTPAVEILWRFAPEHWGQGYATEAARKVLAHAFADLHLPHVVAYTVPANWNSRRVMVRLGMKRQAGKEFDHPGVSENSPLSRHVLYRVTRTEFATDFLEHGVRNARPHELGHLAHIESDASERFRWIGMDDVAEAPLLPRETLARAQSRGTLWVAVSDHDLPLGFALGSVFDGLGYLEELSVLVKASGRGLGRRLIERVETWCRAEGRSELWLSTFRDIPWNRPYYERLGYTVRPIECAGVQLRTAIEQAMGRGLLPDERCLMAKELPPE